MEPTQNFTVPDLKSGAYAVRLRAGRGEGLGEEYIVFFVRPAKPRAKIAFLVPTASYLAYANEHLSFDSQMVQPIMGQPPIVSEVDIELYQTPDFGLSTYDVHADGGGVCYTSYLRPILNMRPKCRIAAMGITWQFPADLSIIAWLEQQGYDYELVTDEDLHREGEAALSPTTASSPAVTPEYYSERMLDATEDYVASGGRYIYMGGNGFYWHVGFRDDEPWCMEVRKLEAGTRAWQARPGEHYLATGGEPQRPLASCRASTTEADRRRLHCSGFRDRAPLPAHARQLASPVWTGFLKASTVRSSAISASPIMVLPGSRSTATISPLAPRRTP